MSSKPWDIPPLQPKGDPTAQALYTSIGRSLTKWEAVEESCGRLFAVLVGAPDDDIGTPAVRAYGSVVSFKARNDMLREAAGAFFRRNTSKDLEKKFKDLMAEYLNYSTRRSEIAHGKVVFIHQVRPDGSREPVGNYLIPNFYNPKKFPAGRIPTYQYTSHEVTYFCNRFDILSQKVRLIVADLRTHQSSP